ncbi:MAG TPA: FixH family protein [Burkholderiaceae bacterium]|nr:FixH family protein [Burkholderiaceae bacterium]
MSDAASLPSPRPAWREPLVWLVAGIPAATVAAGAATWWIAAQRADSNVAEDWYKRGLAVNRSLERESRARAIGLSAEVELRGDHDLRVRLAGLADPPASIRVLLTHPVRAEQDRPLSLDRQPDGGYRIVSPLVGAGRWGLAIEAQDWRIAARGAALGAGRTLRVDADGRVAE